MKNLNCDDDEDCIYNQITVTNITDVLMKYVMIKIIFQKNQGKYLKHVMMINIVKLKVADVKNCQRLYASFR